MITVGAAAALLTACSTASGDTGSSNNAANAAHSTSPGLLRAKAAVTQFTAPATQIAPAAKLVSKAPTGKFIVYIENQTQTLLIDTGQQAADAAKLLGWRIKFLNTDGSVAGEQQAWQQAIALHPDGIITADGVSVADLTAQIAAAKAAKIPVVIDSTTLPNGLQFPIVGGEGGQFVQDRQAGSEAAWIAFNSDGHAHVGLATIESIPVLKSYDALFTRLLKGYCPACTVTIINNAITDVGTNLPTHVVSVLQQQPEINYVATDVGQFLEGVLPALHQAGLASKVQIVGTNPSTEDLAAVKAGTESMWAGSNAEWYGWYSIDSLARYFTHSPLVTEAQAPAPIHILDKQDWADKNSEGQPVDIATGVSYAELVSQFKADWLLG